MEGDKDIGRDRRRDSGEIDIDTERESDGEGDRGRER